MHKIKLNAIQQRFAQETGLTPAKVRDLNIFAEDACKAQVQEHNTGKSSEQAVDFFEKRAEYIGGFVTQWYGLYPTVFKDGRSYQFPIGE